MEIKLANCTVKSRKNHEVEKPNKSKEYWATKCYKWKN